jgi:hypothetical protein
MGSFYRRRFCRKHWQGPARAPTAASPLLETKLGCKSRAGELSALRNGDPCTRRILPVGGRPISTSSRPGWVLLTSEQRYLPGCEIPSRALLAWADACLTARSPNETIPTRRACLVVVSVCPPCSRRARRDQSSSKQSLTCSDMISRTWTSGPWKRSRANASAALQLKRRRTDLTRPRGVRLDGNDDRLLLGLEEGEPATLPT